MSRHSHSISLRSRILWILIPVIAACVSGCSVPDSESDDDTPPPIPVTSGTYSISVATSPQMLELCGVVAVDCRLRRSGQEHQIRLTPADFTDSVPTPLSAGIDSMTRGHTVRLEIASLPDTVDYSVKFIPTASASVATPLSLPAGMRSWFEGARGEDLYVFDIAQRVFYIPDLEPGQVGDYLDQLNSSMTFSVPVTAQ